jgi:molybdopterin molybdotransferase
VAGNGSGDFSNLTASNAFMELPAEKNDFKKGEVYKILPFKTISVHG